MKPRYVLLVGTVLGCVLSLQQGIAAAQEEEQVAKSFDKKAAALLDKYVAVTGGEAAYDAVKTRVIQGELAGKGRGIQGTMHTFFAPGGLFYSEINTVAGVHRRGSNGRTVWKIEPQYDLSDSDLKKLKASYSARIAEGLERVLVLRDGTLDRFGHWRALAEKLEYAGEVDLGDKKCAKVVLTYKPIDPDVKEEPITIYVDLETGLIVRYDTAISRPGQFVKVSAELENYKKVDDILLPHKLTVNTNGVEQYTIRLVNVQNNVPIAAERFVLPAAIQKLLVSGK